MPTANRHRHSVSSAAPPPSRSRTSPGSSAITTEPATQNQALASTARQMRRSARSPRRRSRVEASRSACTRRAAAEGRVAGTSRAAAQDATAAASTTAPSTARAAPAPTSSPEATVPSQDRREGGALHQGVGGGEALARELVGQDAVLHRAEQRRQRAGGHQPREQHRQRAQQQPQGGHAGHGDLRELQPPDQPGLVHPVRELPAEPGQQHGGQHEAAGRRRHDPARRAARRPHHQQPEGVAQEVVAERRQELAGEQRREAALRQQGAAHRPDSVREGRGLVPVAQGLGQGHRAVHQQQRRHRQVAALPDAQRQVGDAQRGHGGGGAEGEVAEGDPGGGVGVPLRHGPLL